MLGMLVVRCMELLDGKKTKREDIKFNNCGLPPECGTKVQSFMHAFGTCCQNYKARY